MYIFVGAPLPYGAKGKIVFHWFDGEDSGGDLGNELDVVVSKAINQHVAVLAKYAHFDGQSGGADIKKFWLQVEVKN